MKITKESSLKLSVNTPSNQLCICREKQSSLLLSVSSRLRIFLQLFSGFSFIILVSSFVFSPFSLVRSLWSILNISPSPWILPSLNFFVFYFYFFTFTQWILCGCELYDLWNNGYFFFNWDPIWKLCFDARWSDFCGILVFSLDFLCCFHFFCFWLCGCGWGQVLFLWLQIPGSSMNFVSP